MRESRGGSDFGVGFRYSASWWWARESVTRARGVSKKSCTGSMYKLGKVDTASEGTTYLAFRHGPQSFDQFKPLFGPVSLLNVVQPRDGQLHHSLNGAFQLTVFLAQDIYTRVELRIVSRVVL